MVYVINASISPTCKLPRSMPFAPNQTINSVMPFMISIISGIIKFMTRLVKSWVPIRSLLALSNLFSSYFSRLKARITSTPVRISLETRFSRSTSSCIFLNLGMATCMRTITISKISATATPMIQPMPVLLPMTLITPPIPRMGAYRTILRSITDTICTCWISLVHRVIRDAVEN